MGIAALWRTRESPCWASYMSGKLLEAVSVTIPTGLVWQRLATGIWQMSYGIWHLASDI